MPRFPLVLASLGLSFNVILWTVPGIVAASVALPGSASNVAQQIGAQHSSSSVRDALIGLIGAEVDAMHVAALAIEQPRTPHLAETANASSARVLDAVRNYVTTVQTTLRH